MDRTALETGLASSDTGPQDALEFLALLPCIVYQTTLPGLEPRLRCVGEPKLLGWTVGELDGRSWLEQVHEEDRAGLQQCRGEALPSAPGYTTRYRIWSPDRSRCAWFEDRATIVRAADGTALAVRGLLLDISELHTALDAAKLAEDRLRSLFETHPAPMWIYDLETLRFIRVNAAASALYGYSIEELLTMTALDVRPADEALRMTEEVKHVPAGLHDFGVWRHRKKDGSELAVHLIKHRLDVLGRPAELVQITDITTQLHAFERAQSAEQRLQHALIQTIELLAATAEQRDPYTAGHQRRVARLAEAMGAELGLADEKLLGLRLGALVHDLGKLGVPAELLSLPRPLTAIEFALIKHHSVAGHQLLKDIALPWPVADMVRQHHERLDGSGYPDGLKGAEVCLEARILAVADTVEAMASHRPYRPALGIERALEAVRNGAGKAFDPEVVRVCFELFEKGFSWPS